MKWIQKEPNEQDVLRIFCFSYAGGGASIYRNWQAYFGEEVGIYPVQLPGREDRLGEEPIEHIDELLKSFSKELLHYSDKHCLLFGHSLGGRIAYAVASYFEKELQTRGLIVSASSAPNCIINKMSALSKEGFLKEIMRLNGTPKEIIENPQVMNLFLPMLRADYKLDDCVDYASFPKVKCKIWGINGTEDMEASQTEMEKWKEFTYGEFELKHVQGGHFFIKENEDTLLNYIKQIAENYIF